MFKKNKIKTFVKENDVFTCQELYREGRDSQIRLTSKPFSINREPYRKSYCLNRILLFLLVILLFLIAFVIWF